MRRAADRLGVRPSKRRGQNFVVDPGTVQRVVRRSGVRPDDVVVEVGPGLGSLTLALLPAVARVVAVEVDVVLAGGLATTVRQVAPGLASRLDVVHADALDLTARDLDALPGGPPTALVANLPYNVAVPVLLTMLERFGSIRVALVMVQAEVADRLAAPPGSRPYGSPSVKAAWYADVRRVGSIARTVFWPVPNVDSGLVLLTRRAPPPTRATRAEVFAVVDAAFAQRRKTLRAALAGWAGSGDDAARVLTAAGIDPQLRGEALDVAAFAALAQAGGDHRRSDRPSP